MNNFANVTHFTLRNVNGVAYMKAAMGMETTGEELHLGNEALMAIKYLARKALGSIPLFRTRILENGVMTFQEFFNEVAETNNMNLRLRVTGVWNTPTQQAFDMLVEMAA